MYNNLIGTIMFVLPRRIELCIRNLERSTTIFDLRARSKGDLTRSCCIPFNASGQEEHFKAYPRSLAQFNQQL